MDHHDLGADALAFVTEHHLATLTTLRADGSPHVVAVGFTYDPGRHVARVITFAGSVKARQRPAPRSCCGLPGRRRPLAHPRRSGRRRRRPGRRRPAVAAYAARYRQPKVRDDRVVIEIAVDRVLGSSSMRGAA